MMKHVDAHQAWGLPFVLLPKTSFQAKISAMREGFYRAESPPPEAPGMVFPLQSL